MKFGHHFTISKKGIFLVRKFEIIFYNASLFHKIKDDL